MIAMYQKTEHIQKFSNKCNWKIVYYTWLPSCLTKGLIGEKWLEPVAKAATGNSIFILSKLIDRLHFEYNLIYTNC